MLKVNQAGSSPPPRGCATEDLDQPGDRGDRGADLDHEHHRVADLDPRVELPQRREQRRAHDLRVEQGAGLVLGHLAGASLSRARLSSSTFTPGSPNRPRKRPSVWSEISSSTRDSGQPADGGDPVRLDPGVGLGDVGVDPGCRLGHRVDRHVGGRQPRVEAALELQVVGEVPLHRVARVLAVGAEVAEEGDGRVVVGLRGPRLEVAWVGDPLRLATLRTGLGDAPGELLGDQARADELAVLGDPRPVRLAGEQHLGDAREGKRVGDPEHERSSGRRRSAR